MMNTRVTRFILTSSLVLFALAACMPGSANPPATPVPDRGAAASPSATPTAAPIADPQPSGGEHPLLTMEEYGYQLRYPAEYQAAVYQNTICLALEQGYGPPGLCHVQNFSIEVQEAGGRTLGQVADEVAAAANPDIPVRRTQLTISGVEAVLLDDIYSIDVLRKVVMIHGDRAYILTFVPWNETLEEFTRLEQLYNTVIESFTFLPRPETGAATESELGISAVSPATIYTGPATDYPPAGVLEAGAAARVLGNADGGWMQIACPEGVAGDCWVIWDMNTLYSYEGPPVALNIPVPASLNAETIRSEASPDGNWQLEVTQSETVSFYGDEAWFFYTELKVTSLSDGTIWTPVSEWHAYGLGHEYAPRPFNWSRDGRYLYYTSLFDIHGGCEYYYNMSDYLNRLDLANGRVDPLPAPYAFGIAVFSPDETMMAYLSGQSINNLRNKDLVVRDLATAYAGGTASQESVKWHLPLDVDWPAQVSQIAWSADSRQLLVTVTELAVNCQPAWVAEWVLDVETGEFVEVSNTVFPTPTP